MLFSNDEIAKYINDHFEASWEMVRAVPLIRIDFGNGNVLTRTLHGNIATYVCAADGQVLDILPGIYSPTKYLHNLVQFRLLANYVDQLGEKNRTNRLVAYHQKQGVLLKKNQPRDIFLNVADLSKARIEGGLKAVLIAGRKTNAVQEENPKVSSKDDLANWKELAADTSLNESARRLQIHALLAKLGTVQPSSVTKLLYKDVLHADLDDPYLGLAKVLFANAAFHEERKASK